MRDKKRIFKKLEHLVVNPNACKYLNSGSNNSYWMYFRDCAADQSYYLVILKGNYIRGFRLRFLDAKGIGMNTFMSVTIPSVIGTEPETYSKHKELITKAKFKDYLQFAADFRAATPALGWS